MSETSKKNYNGAVIICSHAALGKPILYAERSEPDEAVDTGWQFVCDSGVEETVETARVWALDELLALEPSLREFVDYPPWHEIAKV